MFIGNFLIGSLKPAQQLELVQAKNLKKLQIFCKKERLDIVAEDELFDNPEGLETLLADYLQRYSIREELQRKLQQKKLLSQIKIYCDNHDDFCFSEPSAYCTYLKDYGEAQNDYKVTKEAESILFASGNETLLLKMAADNRIFIRENKIRFLKLYRSYPKEIEKYQSQYDKNISWSVDEQFEVVKGNIRLIFGLENVFFKTEALLFEPENESVLLEYASTRRFFHHGNEMRFLLMGKKHPTEVEQYFAKYGKNISLTDYEQFYVVKENIRVIFRLKDVFLKTEALLLEPENESVLLEYASTRRFFYHDNEMRFLLMGQKHPTEVEKYLTKYGKNISLTDDEEFNVVERNKNALQHIKVQSLMVYRDYVLPEMRRKCIPFSEEDLPMLIRLSYDNPLLIEEFIDEHGRLSPKYEAELFFKAEEKCREKYIELYGVNVRTLVKNATKYGATEKEQQLLTLKKYAEFPMSFTLLNKWDLFRKEKIKQMSICEIGKKARELSEKDICGGTYSRCAECRALISSLPVVISVLINIARRNNLLGVG